MASGENPLDLCSFCPLDAESGELLIKNHTDANIGHYACEARNSVGSAQCKYALHAYNRKSVSFCSRVLHPGPFGLKFCHLQISTPAGVWASGGLGNTLPQWWLMNLSPFLASGVAATNKVGVIVGAVIGALLLLLLLLLLLWLLCCCCRKRRYEKEVANEIRYSGEADAHARPASAGG